MHKIYTSCMTFSSCKSFIDIGIDILAFFQRVSREAPKLPIKLAQHLQTAFRCIYSDPRTESNRAGKSNVTYHAPLPSPAFSQYSGATSKMQPPENSWLARRNRISLSHRNRCVSPRLFPRGESKRRRSLILEGETFL